MKPLSNNGLQASSSRPAAARTSSCQIFRRSLEAGRMLASLAGETDIVFEMPARTQNPTMSPPLRASIERASVGEATSSDRFSRIERMIVTCSAFEVASLPLPA